MENFGEICGNIGRIVLDNLKGVWGRPAEGFGGSRLWQIINIRSARGHYVCYYTRSLRTTRRAARSVALTPLSEMDSGVDLVNDKCEKVFITTMKRDM